MGNGFPANLRNPFPVRLTARDGSLWGSLSSSFFDNLVVIKWHLNLNVVRCAVGRIGPVSRALSSPHEFCSLLEHSVGGALNSCGQVTKGTWGMSWRQETLKGVEDCDKPGGVVIRALIPGALNRRTLNPIGVRGKRGELNHLSNRRKRKKNRFRK